MLKVFNMTNFRTADELRGERRLKSIVRPVD